MTRKKANKIAMEICGVIKTPNEIGMAIKISDAIMEAYEKGRAHSGIHLENLKGTLTDKAVARYWLARATYWARKTDHDYYTEEG